MHLFNPLGGRFTPPERVGGFSQPEGRDSQRRRGLQKERLSERQRERERVNEKREIEKRERR